MKGRSTESLVLWSNAFRGAFRLVQGSGFRWPSALCEQHSVQFHRIHENAGSLHRLRPLRAGRHRAGFFEGRQRFGFQIQSWPWVFDPASHGVERYLIGHGLSVRAGSRAVQPAALDSRQSQASVLVSAWAHFGHW
jgi:hypothetical protein